MTEEQTAIQDIGLYRVDTWAGSLGQRYLVVALSASDAIDLVSQSESGGARVTAVKQMAERVLGAFPPEGFVSQARLAKVARERDGLIALGQKLRDQLERFEQILEREVEDGTINQRGKNVLETLRVFRAEFETRYVGNVKV